MQVDLAEKDTNECLYQGKDSPPHPGLSSMQRPGDRGGRNHCHGGVVGPEHTPSEATVLASLLSEQMFDPTGQAHNTWTGTWL